MTSSEREQARGSNTLAQEWQARRYTPLSSEERERTRKVGEDIVIVGKRLLDGREVVAARDMLNQAIALEGNGYHDTTLFSGAELVITLSGDGAYSPEQNYVFSRGTDGNLQVFRRVIGETTGLTSPVARSGMQKEEVIADELERFKNITPNEEEK